MKVIKPQSVGALTRCFEHERRSYLGVSALAFVPLAAAPCLLNEVSMWTFVAETLGSEGALDVGIPKSHAEYLVVGSAHPGGGRATTSCPVRTQVGDLHKELHVFGDRRWKDGAPTDPVPFEEMPLDWAHAYGGQGFAENPLGRGHDRRSLPNVEDPRRRIVDPRDRPEPASFGPIDIAWPQRSALAGTYDQSWLETHHPGFAKDVDWRIFNLAPRDQHQADPWRGDEPYCLENLHPSRPRLEGQLPGLRARSFVTLRRDGDETFEEVALRLTTLWLFPSAERAVLVFQGSMRVHEDDGADVVHLLLGAERLGEPKPVEHYTAVLEQRLDEEEGALHALRDVDLVPEGMPTPPADEHAEHRALSASEGLVAQNMHRRAVREHERARETIVGFGLDPDAFGLEPPTPPRAPPSPDELPAVFAELKAEAKQRQAEAEQRAEALRGRLAENIQQMKEQGLDVSAMESIGGEPQGGPPTFTAAGQRAELLALVDDCAASGTDVQALQAMLDDPKTIASWQRGEEQMREAYRRTAHLQPAAPSAGAHRDQHTRDALRRAVAARAPVTLDLTGVRLDGLDLRGADLRGCFMEGASLRNADLRDAELSGAVLARADLEGANLDGARLVGANLGSATLRDTALRSVDLTDAVLAEARLEGVDLEGACLNGADLRAAHLLQTRARGIEAEQVVLVECELRDVDLSRARLIKATFLELDLRGSVLRHADLTSATFLGCTAHGLDLSGATLDNARFVKDCDLTEAVLVGAHLGRSNLRGTRLDRADFRGAHLDGSDLSGCSLRGALFHRARAREVMLAKADLGDASLLAADLMKASLRGATLYGVDLRGANLHGADLARVRTDSRVRLEDARLTKVCIHPKAQRASA